MSEHMDIDEALKRETDARAREILAKYKSEQGNDRISIQDFGEHWDITIDHENSEGMTGGAECYRVNKKTGEEDMIWHEHPMDMPDMELEED